MSEGLFSFAKRLPVRRCDHTIIRIDSQERPTAMPAFHLVVTSDRYGEGIADLGPDRGILDEFPDLDVTIEGALASTEEEFVAIGQRADCLLVSTRDVISRRVLEQAPKIRVVAVYGVGLNNVDLDAAAEFGVVVTHYPAYCTAEVADHAVSLLLALNRRIIEQDAALHEGAWGRHGARTGSILRGAVPPLREMTVGIIGFGRIGQAFATRMAGFGSTLIAADPHPNDEAARRLGVTFAALPDVLAKADAISIHCPLLPTTRHLIDTDALASMKPDAILVNTARGPIVDLDALVADLEANPLKRAALDVTDPEPLPSDHRLFAMPQVVLTPHSAYYSERSTQVVRRETLVSALRVLSGRMPDVVANPAVLERVALRPA
jgi:lactate dehydrogenase-like 2-hydroxyacid dehydrogenase